MTIWAFLAGGAAAIVLLMVLSRLRGFAAQRPANYAAQAPAIDIRRQLNGSYLCEGVIFGPLGRVSSRFTARMQAEWQGNSCTLREDFLYDDGSRQARAWQLHLTEDGQIRAEAADVIGSGRGQQSGPTVQLLYQLQLPAKSGGHVMSVTDWLYLTPGGTLVNRSQFRKYGVKLAELVATIRPLSREEAAR
ncbi:DUF3833 family protein [Phaeovulum sp. W22_SRMD_FR3]|uniref:DUF3833 family protein n=1 Tax=Phaeovulum sp. W22_SRMD_FR3 TaxID=3240274 RepID=UPI003F9B5EC4